MLYVAIWSHHVMLAAFGVESMSSTIFNLCIVFSVSASLTLCYCIYLHGAKGLFPLITENMIREFTVLIVPKCSGRWWLVKALPCTLQQPAWHFYRLSMWKWPPLHSALWGNPPTAERHLFLWNSTFLLSQWSHLAARLRVAVLRCGTGPGATGWDHIFGTYSAF